jgi:23S rRNA (uracil1939-C5)-methyltransferase
VRLTIDIEDLAPGGEGVGRSGGRIVFVPFTAPGDRALVEVPEAGEPGAGQPGAAAAHGALVAIERAGPVREQPPCRHFGPDGDLCGGCEWLHASYLTQLSAKERALRETLRRLARLEPGAYDLRPILASPAPLRYRTRAKFHFVREAGGEADPGRLAFFRRRSHAPVALAECHLLVPGLDALREALGPALGRARLAPREVALEWSGLDGRGAALLVFGDLTPALRGRAEALLADVPALGGLVLRGEGGPPVLVGDPVLRQARDPADPGAGVQRSRPDVFQQANRGANAGLVAAALDLLRPDAEDVLELFCGAGNFTAPLAARARSVAAVESLGPALDLARADLAAVATVRFFAGDALALARAFARERGASARRFGAALLDPPREGAKGIGPALRDLAVARAAYVSCDPATFARDLRACVEAGFRVVAVQPVDMFPQTHHVEAVALLERA